MFQETIRMSIILPKCVCVCVCERESACTEQCVYRYYICQLRYLQESQVGHKSFQPFLRLHLEKEIYQETCLLLNFMKFNSFIDRSATIQIDEVQEMKF